ncbi:MAG: hypothetical protein R2703_08175 [Micropruina glycogenica]
MSIAIGELAVGVGLLGAEVADTLDPVVEDVALVPAEHPEATTKPSAAAVMSSRCIVKPFV